MLRTTLLCSICFFCFLPPTLSKSLITVDSTLSCNGSLGANIFTDGDFGAGASNLVRTNPMIAPGYSYTLAVPPQDGSYTLTNNTGAWANLFPTWLGIRDNSADPNGYFMVVNASFAPGLFYQETVDGLCANTQYEFSLDIINLIKRNVTGHIRPNVDMLLDNQVVLSTGEIAQNEEWNRYSVSFCTGPNQNSLTLSIRNNAPGGTGNDLGLDNITFRACGPEATVSPPDIAYVCLDNQIDPVFVQANISDPSFQSVQWQWSNDQGQNWVDLPGATDPVYGIQAFASGTYLYRYLLATDSINVQNPNCRLISEVKTLVAVPILYQQTDSICEGSSFQVGNSTYTQSGIYTDSLISSLGCDSIVTTTLIALPQPNTEPEYVATDPSCFGEADATILSIGVPGAIPPLTYTLQGVSSSASGFFDQLPAGTYMLEVTDKFSCTFTASIDIVDPERVRLTMTPDTVVDFGDILPLLTSSNFSNLNYTWSPAEGLSCTACPNPLAFPATSTRYKLLVENEQGCTAQDSVFIDIQKANFLVHAPTAFTPNDDGLNDQFQIIAKSPAAIQRIQSFQVFDRWGKRIYETEGEVTGQQIVNWDGTSKGKFVMTGVYVYVLQVKLIDDRILEYSGNITVLR